MERLLTIEEAAKLIGVSINSMRLYRINGLGPPFVRLGHRTIRYNAESLRAWIASQEKTVSDEG